MLGTKKDTDASANDINLVNQDESPVDTVSSIAWSPDRKKHIFACSDWSSKIRIYEVFVKSMSQKGIACFDTEDPCLSVTWSEDGSKILAGCIKNTVKVYDVNTGKSSTVGQHDAGVSDVHWIPGANTLCSLSFDKTMRFWDLRQEQHIAGFDLGLKPFCSDFYASGEKSRMAIGLQDQKILVVNIADVQQTLSKTSLDYMDSPLGQVSHITAIGFNLDASSIGVAARDGRANISRLDVDAMGRPKLANVMTWKAHKIEAQGSQPQRLYPINAIGFHPKSRSYVFTAGGEGNMTFWDHGKKNKIINFDYKGVPVTRAKMSPEGFLLAYSLGYDWARGIEGYMTYQSKICVHRMQENELYYYDK